MTKRTFILLLAVLAGTALVRGESHADTFTVSLPPGTAVTMGDTSAVLPFTVTNSGPGDIRDITFTINAALYNFSAATVPPPGWCLKSAAAGSIEFALLQGSGACSSGSTASELAGGQSGTFFITLTGPGGTALPAAAADVTADTLSGVAVSVQGGFTLAGGLPVWPRKALAVSLVASPSSLAVNDTITLIVSVTNRATAPQSGITSVPEPPTPVYTGGASVTSIGAAVHGSTATTANPPPVVLTGNINAAASTIGVVSTAGYPPSGRIMIENELIDYTGVTAVSFTGATRGRGGTTAAGHSGGTAVLGQNTASFTLLPAETGTIIYHYRADANGTAAFSAACRNATGTATSRGGSSDAVIIGPFTATVTLSPLSVVSGQVVFVTMTVSNNGASTLTNIVPAIAPGGTAVKNLSTGPSPAGIASLASGESGTFAWTYVITGTPGQTYFFSTSAAAGAQGTNTAVSGTGTINQYAVAGVPAVFATGGSGSITWTVNNRGGAAVKEVAIGIPAPLSGNCGVTSGWGYANNIPPANWSAATTGTPVNRVTFASDTPVDTYGIPVGGAKSFTLSFACMPQVSSDTEYTFPVLITDKNNNQAAINTTITISAYSIGLTAYDENCTSAAPATKDADGDSRYCLKAVLTSGGSPAAGKTLLFSITSGTGTLSAASAVTDAGGVAWAMLTSPCSTTDISTTVKAEYPPLTSATTTLLFTGVAGSHLSYVVDSLTFNRGGTDVNPVSLNTGDAGAFRLQLRNCGTADLTVQQVGTSIAVRKGSADTFALDSASLTLTAGSTAILTFANGTIASGTLQCTPHLTVNAGPGYTGAYSFSKSPAGDLLPYPGDTVTINSGTTCPPAKVKILDWREVVN